MRYLTYFFALAGAYLIKPVSAEAQVSTAIFESPFLSIPSTKLGDQEYLNIALEWDGSTLFSLLDLGQENPSPSKNPAAQYFPQSKILKIQSLSISGRPFRNVNFELNSDGVLEFLSIDRAYSEEYSTISVNLEDYPQSDNPALTLQMMTAIDLNADGRKDILAHYWHNNWNAGADYYGEVPNKLLAFVQDGDRNFTLATEEIFGTEDVNLSGSASRKQAVGDFNADGYPDVAYAMNREDGRPGVYPGTPNWGSLPVVVLSNGDGSYSVTNPGTESIWYHAVAAVPNESGFEDVIYRPLSDGDSALAYRFQSGAWSRVTGYPKIDGWEMQATENIIWSTGVSAVELFDKEGSDWVQKSKISYPASNEEVKVLTWNGDLSNQYLKNILGKDRVAVAFSESCIVDEGRYYVTQMDSRLLPQDWRDFDYVVETSMEQDAPFIVFEYKNDQLIEASGLFSEQSSDRHSYRYACNDVNYDGLDDIFVSTLDGSNLLYLQTNENKFELQSELIFPSAQYAGNRSWRSVYEDIDGDGYVDLLYYNNFPSTNRKEVNFEIYWGR
jgi:hypothetical protein